MRLNSEIMKMFILCVVILNVDSQLQPDYERCGGDGKVLSIHVTPCTSLPCKFPRPTKIEVVFKGAFKHPSKNIIMEVIALQNDKNISLPGVPRDMCLKYVKCPVNGENDERTVKFSFPIQKMYTPKVYTAIFSVYGDSGLEFCFKVDIEVLP